MLPQYLSTAALLHGYFILLSTCSITAKGASLPEETEPSFAEPIPNVTVAAGRSVNLPCVVENLNGFKVAWIHTNRHMLLTLHDRIITRNPRYTVSHNGHRTWWLHIQNVEESDSGEYMCQINTSPMKSQVGYLEVVVPPKIDEEHTSSDTDVREGGDVSLQCQASGSPPPKIKWRREDQKDITYRVNRSSKSDSGSSGEFLNITKVSRLHMGAYLCIASNGVQPSVSKRMMLNVNFAPMIWIPNQLVGAPLDTDVLLDCGLESHPKSVTYWTKEGGIMILSNAKYDSVLLDTGLYKAQMRLRIRNLSPEDFGSYTCVAKNSLGETEGTIKLYEIPRPTTTTSTVSQYTYKTSKTDGSLHTTSEKMLIGTWQNSLVKDETHAARKTELSTELLDQKGSTMGVVPAPEHDFREQGPERKEGRRYDASSAGCNVQLELQFLAPLLISLFLISGYGHP